MMYWPDGGDAAAAGCEFRREVAGERVGFQKNR